LTPVRRLATPVSKVALKEIAPNRKRGGDLRVLLSPVTVGATSGFMGAGTLDPGDVVTDHYHPYSEEFLYIVRGSVTLIVDGAQTLRVDAGEAVMVPRSATHRLENRGTGPAFAVFHTAPLAPSPDLGHVDVLAPRSDGPDPRVGGSGAVP
jgi:putative monooxygenase